MARRAKRRSVGRWLQFAACFMLSGFFALLAGVALAGDNVGEDGFFALSSSAYSAACAWLGVQAVRMRRVSRVAWSSAMESTREILFAGFGFIIALSIWAVGREQEHVAEPAMEYLSAAVGFLGVGVWMVIVGTDRAKRLHALDSDFAFRDDPGPYHSAYVSAYLSSLSHSDDDTDTTPADRRWDEAQRAHDRARKIRAPGSLVPLVAVLVAADLLGVWLFTARPTTYGLRIGGVVTQVEWEFDPAAAAVAAFLALSGVIVIRHLLQFRAFPARRVVHLAALPRQFILLDAIWVTAVVSAAFIDGRLLPVVSPLVLWVPLLLSSALLVAYFGPFRTELVSAREESDAMPRSALGRMRPRRASLPNLSRRYRRTNWPAS